MSIMIPLLAAVGWPLAVLLFALFGIYCKAKRDGRVN
jgi:hypothetical protein